MRLRFAPSPTGALHIGGARTALFNWLLARGSGGQLVLRIEDTDKERSTPENLAQIIDALNWLQIDWDEGPIMQSERAQRHQQELERLIGQGHAYLSTATAEDVKAYKAKHGADRGFRGQPEAEGAVRLRVPDEGATIVHDVIRGQTRFEHIHLDDPVIARADGSVLYNFAVAIDDLDAGITHVVRGEDHLSNTPKQLLVLEALGAPQPLYAHVPLLHGPDGKKLSKRHGAASVQELRDAGYLPAAVRNYIALLGWGSENDETILATEDLVAQFKLERVSRNPARFDETKLRWMNGVYIRSSSVTALAGEIEEYLGCEDPDAAAAVRADPGRLQEAVRISQEKIQTLKEFWPLAGFLFQERELEEKARARWLDENGVGVALQAREELAALQPDAFGERSVQQALEGLVERLQVKPGNVYQPLRVAISGKTTSPGIFESIALLGQKETLRRIDVAAGNGRPQHFA
jgi:glutamyl-tRNA synthetase